MEVLNPGCHGCQHVLQVSGAGGLRWRPCQIIHEGLADDGCHWLPLAAMRFELRIEPR